MRSTELGYEAAVETLTELLFAVLPYVVVAGALFNLVTVIEELSNVRTGDRARSVVRTVVLVFSSVVLFQLGLVSAVTDPRHGSEIVGIPMLIAAGLGAVAFPLRVRRHFRRAA